MKKTHYTFIFLTLVAAAFLLVACGGEPTATAAEIEPAAVSETVEKAAVINNSTVEQAPIDNESTSSDAVISEQAVPDYSAGPVENGQAGTGQGAHVTPAGELSPAEIDALLYMREEEKLARDVYLALYDTWGSPIFNTIAASEQVHMNAIAYLLNAYDLGDPAAGMAAGQFQNNDLQELYDKLIAQGQRSLQDALLVGAAIEEIDILDLQGELAVIENEAVIQVFESLLAGSENHLRAFAANLERQTSAAYAPQYMNQGAYDALAGSTSGQGNGQGSANGAGQGQGQGNANGGGQGQGKANGGGQGQGNVNGGSRGQGNGGGRGRSS